MRYQRSGQFLFLSLIVIGAIVSSGAQAIPDAMFADFVVKGARITTGDPSRPDAQAAAVKNGRFTAVGDNATVELWIGPKTRVLDAQGRRVVAGFTDSHLHFLRGGFRWQYEIRADGVKLLEEIFQRISERASKVPAGTWINVGGGWHFSHLRENRMPTREELDKIAPNHPVNVQSRYEQIQLNSAGIRASGLDKEKIPEDAKPGRDAQGRFSGELHGMPGVRFLETRLPQATFDEKVKGMRGLMTHLNTLGVTSVIEAGGGGIVPEDYQALFELRRQGDMTLRVTVRISPGGGRGGVMPWILAMPGRLGDEWMRITGFGESLHPAGSATPDQQTPQGLAEFEEGLSAAAANRLTVQQHTVETEAVTRVVEAMERVNKVHSIRALRFAIIHGEGLTPELLKRMKAMGVAFSADIRRMLFKRGAYADDIPDTPLVRTALDLGVPLVVGSDGLIAGPINPIMWLYSLVTGKNWAGEVTRPNQKLTRQEALDAVTRAGAWLAFEEQNRGTIAVGQLADFVVLDRDYFSVPEDEIGDIKVVTTVVGGRVVYDTGAAAAGSGGR